MNADEKIVTINLDIVRGGSPECCYEPGKGGG